MSEHSLQTLQDKRVLVTGASSGIGAALAIEAARRGAQLLLHGRDEERLAQTARTCEAAGAAAPELFALELLDLDDRRALVQGSAPVDIAVLNAGLLVGGPFEEADENRILALLRVNIEAPMHLARLLAPGLAERAGSLVLVSSGVARQPLPYNVVYNSSKVALTSFGRALALEWEHRGCPAHVFVSHPGATQTPMLEGVESEKRSPQSVAIGSWDAFEAGKRCWWASGEDPELLAQYEAEDARARERAPMLREFFGGVQG
ncbi:MAG: oxidoreductase [Planctomycetota bacterium]|nr:MAG: oxidoreductase [Planctomycetota bacterium]